MENENQQPDPQNGAARTATGALNPAKSSKTDQTEVSEGNASKARPTYGADAGPNTSSREDQLPTLNNAVDPGADADGDLTDVDQQVKGSDADHDKSGSTSI